MTSPFRCVLLSPAHLADEDPDAPEATCDEDQDAVEKKRHAPVVPVVHCYSSLGGLAANFEAFARSRQMKSTVAPSLPGWWMACWMFSGSEAYPIIRHIFSGPAGFGPTRLLSMHH